MLSITAFAMVTTFMVLIMTKRMTALIALIVVPIAFALLTGHHDGLGKMMMEGVKGLAPTGVMLLFAILYFGLMIDAGLFDPLVKRIVRIVHGDPVKVLVGTAVLALLVSLDGDGTTTYMITVSALLPLYRHLNMNVRMMTCIIIMAAAITNLTPWGGPTARAATALNLDPGLLFIPMLPSMLVTALYVIGVAWYFGIKERRRLGASIDLAKEVEQTGGQMETWMQEDHDATHSTRRPRLLWFNAALTAGLMAMLMMGVLPLAVLFMMAFAIAMMVNYPRLDDQKDRLRAHAGNALAVVSLIFAAGIFTGILSGTKMVDAMADSVIAMIPDAVGPYMAPITAIISMPFTFFISNDAFYFGMLPILARTAAEYGISMEAIGRASLIGQQVHLLSPLVPSTYLLVGMAKVDIGDHQRFTLKWALGACFVMLAAGLLFGTFPFAA